MRAYVSAILALLLWGIIPVYWKLLKHIPAYEILAHRVIWTVLFTAILIQFTQSWRWVLTIKERERAFLPLFASATLIGVNWLGFIWGVNAGYVLECSLGYFICPLVTVLIGRIFLKERLKRSQWIAVGLAAIGVAIKAVGVGSFPWLAIFLAVTFAAYVLLRRLAPFESLQGLWLESLLLTPFAVLYLTYLSEGDANTLLFRDSYDLLLLSLAGPITAIPLLLYAYSARRLPFSTLGMINYIAPTMQFLLAVFLFKEPFTATDFAAFLLIWVAVGAYLVRRTTL